MIIPGRTIPAASSSLNFRAITPSTGGFKAPSNITSNFTLTLPATDSPVSGYALVSNGSGTLSCLKKTSFMFSE